MPASAIFAWEEPPAKDRRGAAGRRPQFADALTQLRNPEYIGKWARITSDPLEGKKAQSHAARIRNGLVADVVAGEFDASDDEGNLFACYLGPDGIARKAVEVKQRADRKAAKAAAAAAGEPVTDDDDDDADDDPALLADPDADDAPQAVEAVAVEAPQAVEAPAAASNDAFGW